MTTNPLYGIPATLVPTPSADVLRWRLRRLTEAGFGDELAGALAAERDIDLHALLNLVDRGCPPHLAARIMGSRAIEVELSAMDEVEPVVTVIRPHAVADLEPLPHDDWVSRLRDDEAGHEATRELHELMVRAARHQLGRMPEAGDLGWARRDEIVQAAADEATVSVLTRLDRFEGRSRFTTWAYKFAILQTAVEVRRSAWRRRETDLTTLHEPVSEASGPQAYAESSDLTRAVWAAMDRVLTEHQHRVAVALLVECVPIDVLAERLGSNRNALYKTLHDVRVRLRRDLTDRGYLCVTTSEEAIS